MVLDIMVGKTFSQYHICNKILRVLQESNSYNSWQQG